MPYFRKKPIVIEAVKLTKENWPDIIDWMTINGAVFRGESEGLIVETLEGDMTAQFGDWILRGLFNEFYPCKPDVFEASYELVDGNNDVV